MSEARHLQDLAERLAGVARHTFETALDPPGDSLTAGFVHAMEQLMAEGMSADEAYQQIFARLADGVADG